MNFKCERMMKMRLNRSVQHIVLIITLILALTACAPENPSRYAQESIAATGETEAESDIGIEINEDLSEVSPTSDDSRQTEENILVAYFSYTGNTEEIALQIADLTGGVLAEIQRAEEYGDLQEEAEAEILEGVRPKITISIENVEDYDTVFVGYPIWWDEAPAMIATFLESYDFSGKTIIPFCTSASDSIENSLHIFSELCPDSDIAEGLTANEQAEIEPWLRSLGLIQERNGENSAE